MELNELTPNVLFLRVKGRDLGRVARVMNVKSDDRSVSATIALGRLEDLLPEAFTEAEGAPRFNPDRGKPLGRLLEGSDACEAFAKAYAPLGPEDVAAFRSAPVESWADRRRALVSLLLSHGARRSRAEALLPRAERPSFVALAAYRASRMRKRTPCPGTLSLFADAA